MSAATATAGVAPAAPVASAKPANISLGTLSAMFRQPRTAAGESSATGTTTQTTSTAETGEQTPARKGKRRAAPAASTAAPAQTTATTETTETAPALGAETTTETASQETAAEQTTETAQQTETTGTETAETGAEETGEETAEQAAAAQIHPEVQKLMDELKAAGDHKAAHLLKRVYKLVNQKNTHYNARLQAEERLATAEARVQELQNNPDARTAPTGDRLTDHPDVRAVDQQLAQAEQILQWAEENPDGAELDGRNFTRQDMAHFKRTAESNRIRLTAERATKIAGLQQLEGQTRAQCNTLARKAYPWLLQRDSPEYAEADRFVRACPAHLRSVPGIELIAGRYVAGLLAERARAAAPAKPKPAAAPVRQPPPVASGASAQAPAAAKPKTDASKKQITVRDLAGQFAQQQADRAAQRRAA